MLTTTVTSWDFHGVAPECKALNALCKFSWKSMLGHCCCCCCHLFCFHLFIHFFSTGFFLPAIWPVLSFCSPFSCQRSGQFGVVWGFLASDLASSFVLACHFLASGWLVSFHYSVHGVWCLFIMIEKIW